MNEIFFKIVGVDLVLRAYSAHSMYFTIMSALIMQPIMPKALSFRVGRKGDFGSFDFSCDVAAPASLSFVNVVDVRGKQDELWDAMKLASLSRS